MKIRPQPNRKTFWITNISNRNVTLSDLGISIRALSIADLSDPKRYPHLSYEQIEKSYASGSLFLKKHMIRKREIQPVIDEDTFKMVNTHFSTSDTNTALMMGKLQMDPNALLPSRQRSVLEIKIEEYEELSLSDDKEASLKQEFDAVAENADTVAYDTQPLLPKK